MISFTAEARRPIDEVVTPAEAVALKAAGFHVRRKEEFVNSKDVDATRAAGYEVTEKHRGTRSGSIYYLLRPRVSFTRSEWDALRFARGALAGRPPADTTRSPVHSEISANRTRLNNAAPEYRLGVVLASKPWRGSTVEEEWDPSGKRVYTIRHPSGARMRLLCEAAS